MPHVSVVLPFRDAAVTLGDCLESLRRQTLQCFEVLAVDDGSGDASTQIALEAAGQDPRIRILRPGRVGLVFALNLGVAQARSPLIARMDADDLMHEARLEAQVDYLRAHPDIALVGSQVALFPEHRIGRGYREYIRWQNGCLSPEEIAANLYVESPLAHPSVMVRRRVIEGLGGYGEGPFPEDYELWLRMHEAGFPMAKLPGSSSSAGWDGRLSRLDPRYSREAFDRPGRASWPKTPGCVGIGRSSSGARGAGRAFGPGLIMDRGVWPRCVDRRGFAARSARGSGASPCTRPCGWIGTAPFVLVYVTRHGSRDEVSTRSMPWDTAAGWISSRWDRRLVS